jgi:N-acetylglucosamine-6-phosphate deacetylase
MRLGVIAAVVGSELVPGDVAVEAGRVRSVGVAPAGRRGIAVPGFVDLHVNGVAGVDFLTADATGYRRAGEALLEAGVAAYLPTFVTRPEDELVAALGEVPRSSTGGPRVLGAHLEGPFLSPARLGVHEPAGRRDPDPRLLRRLLAAGPVRLVTLAPELPGADALIDALHGHRVTVSLGHSDATAEQAHAAFERGVHTVTHLFNAMRPFHHRDPGVAGAALARDDVVVQLILDGRHLAPETADLVWRAARGRTALVSDGIAATRDPSRLEGGTATMLEAVRNLHTLGAPLPEAVAAAATIPAAVLGLRDAGRLAPGLPADIVVLDDRLEIARVLVGSARL